MSTSIISIERQIVPEPEPDTSWLEDTSRYDGVSESDRTKYEQQDRERLAAYIRGDWYMVGVRAVAEIAITTGEGVIAQRITSPGIWNTESDSDEAHFAELYQGELETLAEILIELGFGTSDICEAAPDLDTSNWATEE